MIFFFFFWGKGLETKTRGLNRPKVSSIHTCSARPRIVRHCTICTNIHLHRAVAVRRANNTHGHASFSLWNLMRADAVAVFAARELQNALDGVMYTTGVSHRVKATLTRATVCSRWPVEIVAAVTLHYYSCYYYYYYRYYYYMLIVRPGARADTMTTEEILAVVLIRGHARTSRRGRRGRPLFRRGGTPGRRAVTTVTTAGDDRVNIIIHIMATARRRRDCGRNTRVHGRKKETRKSTFYGTCCRVLVMCVAAVSCGYVTVIRYAT